MLTKENGFALPFHWKFPDAGKYTFTFISLFIILIAVYSNSFQGDWHFDDYGNVLQNKHIQIKSFSWDEIWECIHGIDQNRIIRPLSYLSLALNYYFNGLDVFGYHVVNFIIHYLSSLFLFLFIYNTLQLPLIRNRYENIAYPVALLATFLWAIHPVFVTSVTYIVQRMASMSGMFYILSMYLYLKARTTEKTKFPVVFFVGCTLTGFAAILSKENAVMLPVSIILFDLFLIQGATKDNIIKFGKILILPLLLITVLGLIYTGGFSNILDGYSGRDFSLTQRLLTEPRVILFYLSLLFYPLGSRLTLLYDIEVSRSFFQPWTTLPAILMILIIIFFAFFMARKRPLLSFCIFFFFINHLIEGSFIPLELIYEHRNYIPAMLLFIPVADFIIFTLDHFSYKKTIQFACIIGVIVILTGLGDITYRRNSIFIHDESLWLDNINKYNNLSRPYLNLGNIYFSVNLYEKGWEAYTKAAAVNNFANTSSCALLQHNFGKQYFQANKYDKALPYFERSLEIRPDYHSSSIHIAKIKLLQGKIAEARKVIQDSLEYHPQNTNLLEMASLISLKENNFHEANKTARIALQTNPSSTLALKIRAEIARIDGNYYGSIMLWNLYRHVVPHSVEANLALIELYHKMSEITLLKYEIARLNCYKQTKSYNDYIDQFSRAEYFFVYSPNKTKIIEIVRSIDLKK